MEHSARHALTLMLTLSLGAACGGSDNTAVTTTDAAPAVTPAPTPATTTTPTTASSPTTTAPITTPPPDDRDIAAAVEGWIHVWTQAGDPTVDVAAITGVEPTKVAPSVRALTGADIDGTTTITITHQIVSTTPQPDGSITITDCALFEPHPNTPIPSQHLTGTMTPVDHTWTMTDITRHDRGCIPADTNDAILAAYHAYWEALEASGNPPDPDHPDLDTTIAGNHLDGIHKAFQRMRDAGDVYLGIPDLDPFVSNLLDQGSRAIVLDCVTANTDTGTFTRDGQRVWPTRDPQPEVIQLENVDGGWIVTGRDEDHATCYPKSYRLEVIYP